MLKKNTQFWPTFSAFFLAFCWLLPNHAMPWLGFQSDAWAALVLLVIGVAICWLARDHVAWPKPVTYLVVISVIPLAQYFSGLVVYFGIAWINFAYMLGLAIAVLVGCNWERFRRGQAADCLFLAVTLASLCSIILQLRQLFVLEGIGPWLLYSTTARHAANMAQPNQLASLLLLGLLGCAWWHRRQELRNTLAIAAACLILLGIAITSSRTAWVNLCLFALAAVYWRRLHTSRHFPVVVIALLGYFFLCVSLLPHIADFFGGGIEGEFRSPAGDARFTAWAMFLDALVHRPLAGFGWGQLAHAQFLMMDEKIAFGGSFLQSHNLFLDMLLWNGVLVGGIMALGTVWFFVRVFMKLGDFESMLYLMFATVLLVHAMLEYPLQYAYFLLPFGMMVGVLCTSCAIPAAKRSTVAVWPTAALLLCGTLVLTITIVDYLKVETSFYGLRFEQRKIPTDIPPIPPDVLVLTQWESYIKVARLPAVSAMPPAAINEVRDLASTVPSAFVMYKLAAILAMNDQRTEASAWLRRLCQVSPAEHCELIKTEWLRHSALDTHYRLVPWPALNAGRPPE